MQCKRHAQIFKITPRLAYNQKNVGIKIMVIAGPYIVSAYLKIGATNTQLFKCVDSTERTESEEPHALI